MARDLIQESHYISRGGMIPIKWTAPEVCHIQPANYSKLTSLSNTKQAIHYKTYSSASDVWSFGALMYEIWSVGHKPYEDYANNKVRVTIKYNSYLKL